MSSYDSAPLCKVVRYERALAELAQGSTLRKAAEKFQLNKTNLQRFSRTGKYGLGRQGRVSTVFTFQEERTIKACWSTLIGPAPLRSVADANSLMPKNMA